MCGLLSAWEILKIQLLFLGEKKLDVLMWL